MRIFILIIAIIAFLLLGFEIVMRFFFVNPFISSSTMGIIGGADGPTSIVVATSPTAIYYLIFYAIVFIACVIGFIILKKKRK